MQQILSSKVRCFTLRQRCKAFWSVLDEEQMRQVEERLDQVAQELAQENDPNEMQYWLEMVDLLEQALEHLERLYQHRVAHQEYKADEQEMMQMMNTVSI